MQWVKDNQQRRRRRGIHRERNSRQKYFEGEEQRTPGVQACEWRPLCNNFGGANLKDAHRRYEFGNLGNNIHSEIEIEYLTAVFGG